MPKVSGLSACCSYLASAAALPALRYRAGPDMVPERSFHIVTTVRVVYSIAMVALAKLARYASCLHKADASTMKAVSICSGQLAHRIFQSTLVMELFTDIDA